MDRQSELLVTWAEMPRSPGHVFYDRLQAELVSAGFDNFVEGQCVPYYAAHRGRCEIACNVVPLRGDFRVQT